LRDNLCPDLLRQVFTSDIFKPGERHTPLARSWLLCEADGLSDCLSFCTARVRLCYYEKACKILATSPNGSYNNPSLKQNEGTYAGKAL
jgi:hypothetical protein